MGCWLVNADTLAGSRFVISALAETTAGLLTLATNMAAHLGAHFHNLVVGLLRVDQFELRGHRLFSAAKKA
ncbi:hypothetical protein AB0M95_39255, partial [Sphaerisporangium sp. NPDC051017]